jgi:PhzF family phenazine biosynthesis protein
VRSFDLILADVFTDRPFSGNQLPVVLGADALSTAEMQAIALELASSEMTFVLEPTRPDARWRLRCFSPTDEIFGAGHNALGAWWVIAERGLVQLDGARTMIQQEIGDRVLPVALDADRGELVRVAMTQEPARFGEPLRDGGALAEALGLAASDLDTTIAPRTGDTGATHLLVALRTRDALARIRVDAPALLAVARPLGAEGCYAFTLETGDARIVARSRGFFPGIGIAEDPATGTAAGPLTALLVSLGRAQRDAWHTIAQGVEMKRPSRIEGRVSDAGIEVAGRSVVVAEGKLRA